MKFSIERYTDNYVKEGHPLRLLDARMKMGISAALLLAILASSQSVLPIIVTVVSIAVLLMAGIPARVIMVRFVPPLASVLVLVAVQFVLIGETPLHTLSVAGISITLKCEGVVRGMHIGLRVLGAVSILLLLSFLTSAHDIFRTLRWCRVPATWVEIALLMYRYLFVFLEEASAMAEAQRVRLGYAGIRRSLISMGDLMGAVIVRSMEQSMITQEAMTARGCAEGISIGSFSPMPWFTRVGLAGAVAGIGLAYALIEWGIR
jgi:cobalt/nickel transport system permease protein